MSKTQVADLVIVGAGPAGLSAAMNAASEGLSVKVIEAEDKVGGQAKHSSRIENYLGFPNGLTGPQLMSRAYTQAKRFGAEFVTGLNAVGLTLEGHYKVVGLSDGQKVISKAVLLTNGLQCATPRTAWLNEACELDEKGFVKTTDFHTSCLGVFAAGDIRSGSVKRIAASAGEGSAVVPRIHAYIATLGV